VTSPAGPPSPGRICLFAAAVTTSGSASNALGSSSPPAAAAACLLLRPVAQALTESACPSPTPRRLAHQSPPVQPRRPTLQWLLSSPPQIHKLLADCDNPPREIPYYRLNQSTLVIKQ
jgi:hypothetical protein